MVNYEEIAGDIKNIARKYSRGLYGMDADDFEQELWLDFIEKKYDDIAWAKTSLKNKAIDIYRKYKSREDRSFSFDFSEPVSDYTTENLGEDSEESNFGSCFESPESCVEFKWLIESLMREFVDREDSSEKERKRNKRCRNFIICKGYLECGIDLFRDDFFRVVREEIEDEIERAEFLNNYKNCTSDMILKAILHFPTGKNSGSFPKMKWEDLHNFYLGLKGLM